MIPNSRKGYGAHGVRGGAEKSLGMGRSVGGNVRKGNESDSTGSVWGRPLGLTCRARLSRSIPSSNSEQPT